MREILFRGKRKDTGEWIYGHLHKMDGYGTGYTEYGIQVQDISTSRPWSVLVVPDTVGQYTGLTDKNGKKIFEGDIVSTDITRPYLIVEFRDGCFMFNCNDGGKDYYDIMLPICKEAHTEYEYGEIIGNIHDNPELMKGGAE